MKTIFYEIFSAPFSVSVRRDRRLTYGVIVFALATLALGATLAKHGHQLFWGGNILGLLMILVGVLLFCIFRWTEKSLAICLKNWLGVPIVVTILAVALIFWRMLNGQELAWKPLLLIAALWWGAWLLMSVAGYFAARVLDWLDARLYPKNKEGQTEFSEK